MDEVKREEDGARAPGPLGPEAVAFAMDIGICIGNACPMSRQGCDPRCPALSAWVEVVADG